MRDKVTTALEVLGFGLLTAAAALAGLALGLAVGGASCIVIGYLAGRRG